MNEKVHYDSSMSIAHHSKAVHLNKSDSEADYKVHWTSLTTIRYGMTVTRLGILAASVRN